MVVSSPANVVPAIMQGDGDDLDIEDPRTFLILCVYRVIKEAIKATIGADTEAVDDDDNTPLVNDRYSFPFLDPVPLFAIPQTSSKW